MASPNNERVHKHIVGGMAKQRNCRPALTLFVLAKVSKLISALFLKRGPG